MPARHASEGCCGPRRLLPNEHDRRRSPRQRYPCASRRLAPRASAGNPFRHSFRPPLLMRPGAGEGIWPVRPQHAFLWRVYHRVGRLIVRWPVICTCFLRAPWYDAAELLAATPLHAVAYGFASILACSAALSFWHALRLSVGGVAFSKYGQIFANQIESWRRQ
jgi:hypothetical protein